MSMMKDKLIALLVCAAVLCPAAASARPSLEDDYRQAMELYEAGMFERAETLFGRVHSATGDVLARGYEVLCSVRLQERGYQPRVEDYAALHPESKLLPQIHFYHALNLFDARDYSGAALEFSRVGVKSLYGDQMAEFRFKEAYSRFELGELDRASDGFEAAEKMPHSDFTAPSRYFLGYILYTRKAFGEASRWFELAAKDPRFTEISNHYLLECRFMQKDYRYVVDNGVPGFDETPEERRPHLARLISESYLALGDKEKARDYYGKITKSRNDMDRDDFFYAGSLLYATEDFKGAIDNYSLMASRTDSIGQIANYQLGYSHIKTGNKVAAMEAFKSASALGFNPDIQEDAHFNYAKLAFDLNHSPAVFNDYLAKFSDKKKGDRIYSYIALANLYNHNYSAAVEAYSNIDLLDEDQKANYMRANYLRANQLIESGSWRDAVPLLRAASFYSDKRSTFNQLSKYWLAESYFRSGQYDKAIEEYTALYNNSALDGKPEGGLIPYNLAYCHFQREEFDKAARWFDSYLQGRSPAEGEDAAVRRADCDFLRKDYQAAIKEYEKALGRFPFSGNLYPSYQAGLAYGLTGNIGKKIELLSKALTAKPTADYYSEAMYELGRAYVSAERNDEAMDCFKKLKGATKDKSISARALIELGMISRNMSEYNQALSYYKQVVDQMPGTEFASDALLAIESIYQSEGRTDEFLDYADKAGLNKDKSDSEKEEMYFNAAEQMYLAGNHTKALSLFQGFIDRFPDGELVSHASFYIAECHRSLGSKELACDWYAKALEKDNGSSFAEIAMLNFSKLSYDLEHYKEAYGGYSSLLSDAKIENNRHTARVGMMMSAFKDGDFSNALSCAGRVKDDSKSAEAEIRRADWVVAKSHLAMGDRDEAFRVFKELSSDPSTDEGAEAAYMLVQDAYDQGDFASVEAKVYKFSDTAGGQTYWLAKSFIVLGDAFAEQDNLVQAKATFESILNGYVPETGPADDVLDNVKMRLGKLKNLMDQQ